MSSVVLARRCWAVAATIRDYVEQIQAGNAEPVSGQTPIHEYPLELLVGDHGRELAVVLCTGPAGPYIEVVAEGPWPARLEGYRGIDHYTMHGDYFDVFLDYFIDREEATR